MEQPQNDSVEKNRSDVFWKVIAFSAIALLAYNQFVSVGGKNGAGGQPQPGAEEVLETSVLPKDGIDLPVKWNDFGSKMIEAGVIDGKGFEKANTMDDDIMGLLYGDNQVMKITEKNSRAILNFLWAFGLANKNPILDKGPMKNPRYGGAGRFASTGGWTLAKGDAMDHYSRHEFIALTDKQQKLVEDVSKNIYRPCCGNSTYFPDCNHGMAMLGLLELMAANGVGEEEMYRVALQVNSYWFPDTYLTLAKYFAGRGVAWAEVSPKEMLGSVYSGAAGYAQIKKEVEPSESRGGGSCGV